MDATNIKLTPRSVTTRISLPELRRMFLILRMTLCIRTPFFDFMEWTCFMEWPTGPLHHNSPASSLTLAQVNDLTLAQVGRASAEWPARSLRSSGAPVLVPDQHVAPERTLSVASRSGAGQRTGQRLMVLAVSV